MKQIILTKLKKEYPKLEYSIMFLKVRRLIVVLLFVAIHIIALMIGGEALYIAFILFGIPLWVIYIFQGTKLREKNRRLNELEKIILSSKE